MPDGLREMRLADARRADNHHVLVALRRGARSREGGSRRGFGCPHFPQKCSANFLKDRHPMANGRPSTRRTVQVGLERDLQVHTQAAMGADLREPDKIGGDRSQLLLRPGSPLLESG